MRTDHVVEDCFGKSFSCEDVDGEAAVIFDGGEQQIGGVCRRVLVNVVGFALFVVRDRKARLVHRCVPEEAGLAHPVGLKEVSLRELIEWLVELLFQRAAQVLETFTGIVHLSAGIINELQLFRAPVWKA